VSDTAKSSYFAVFENINNIVPLPSNDRIKIEYKKSELYTGWDVFSNKENDPKNYDIEFMPWYLGWIWIRKL